LQAIALSSGHGARLADGSAGGVMADKQKVEGEGSYSGTKDYNERTQKFIESGKVKAAARKAAPKDEAEKHAMQKAERVGRERAKK